MPQLPYMPFFHADYLGSGSIPLLTPTQECAYVRCLLYAWASGDASLPDNDQALQFFGRWNGEGDFAPVRAKFIPHPDKPGFLTQVRLYAEWQKSLGEVEKRKARAQKGNAVRWKNKTKLKPVKQPPVVTGDNGQGRPGCYTQASHAMAFLREKTGKRFQDRRPNGEVSKGFQLAVNLFKKGYTDTNVRQVIANRCLKWHGDPKMAEYLRPETLFRLSNFESYLGEIGKEAPYDL